jgi:DNA-binding transcriptional ArsR family regulator
VLLVSSVLIAPLLRYLRPSLYALELKYNRAMQVALEAIAHPGRRRMLELVMQRERQAGELAELTRMTQPAASQHLRVLRQAGLVEVRRDGQRRLYHVNFAALQTLRAQLDDFWGDRLSALKKATKARK